MSNSSETVERQPASLWQRLSLVLGVLILILVVIGLVHNNMQQAANLSRMQRAQADLDASDPKWKLEDIEAARVDPPASKNSALVVVALSRALPRNWPTPAFTEVFNDLQPPHLLTPEQQTVLEREMASIDPQVQLARRLAELKVGRHKLDYGDNPWNVLLDDQQESRKAARLLQYDAMLEAHRADMGQALRSSKGILNAGRSLYDEPIMISQLIRIACVIVSLETMERILSMGEPTDGMLADVQELLADEEKHETFMVCIRGERAMQHLLWMNLMNGRIDLKELLGSDPAEWGLGWKTRWFGLSRERVRRDYPAMLELLTRYVEAARLPPQAQPAAYEVIDKDIRRVVAKSPLLRLSLPAVEKVNESCQRKTVQVSCMRVLVGVERYRLAKGKWPVRLEDVPKDLLGGDIPLDPYDGNPLRYKRVADGVIVYSIGRDRADNGGNLNRSRPASPGVDQGYRLWDVAKRRQPPLPPPARGVPEEGLPGGPPMLGP